MSCNYIHKCIILCEVMVSLPHVFRKANWYMTTKLLAENLSRGNIEKNYKWFKLTLATLANYIFFSLVFYLFFSKHILFLLLLNQKCENIFNTHRSNETTHHHMWLARLSSRTSPLTGNYTLAWQCTRNDNYVP